MADTLVDELRRRGHEAALVTVPFKWYPGERVLTHAFLWRLVDLDEVDGRAIDTVIATKFPAYCVRHPNKVAWVLHQFRQAYELDRVALSEARRLFATSQNVAGRIGRSTGLHAEVLPHPPQELPYRCDSYGDFILSVNRLDRAKRIDLLVEAAAARADLKVVVAGDGPDRQRLEGIARNRGLDGRIRFAGRVSDDELTELYAGCR